MAACSRYPPVLRHLPPVLDFRAFHTRATCTRGPPASCRRSSFVGLHRSRLIRGTAGFCFRKIFREGFEGISRVASLKNVCRSRGIYAGNQLARSGLAIAAVAARLTGVCTVLAAATFGAALGTAGMAAACQATRTRSLPCSCYSIFGEANQNLVEAD